MRPRSAATPSSTSFVQVAAHGAEDKLIEAVHLCAKLLALPSLLLCFNRARLSVAGRVSTAQFARQEGIFNLLTLLK